MDRLALALCVGHLKILKSSLLSLSEIHTGRLLMMPVQTSTVCMPSDLSVCKQVRLARRG
jgi:hypothetical protein